MEDELREKEDGDPHDMQDNDCLERNNCHSHSFFDNCCSHLKILHTIELDKSYPRDIFKAGRARVQLKKDDGSPMNPAIKTKMEESGFAITSINGRINRAVWGPLNRTIVTAREDATIRIWDSELDFGKKLPSFFFIQKGMAFSDDGKMKVDYELGYNVHLH
ncbi:Signal recognition particle protein [Zea mays]|uniref:Signal recognition particle protein n=1 Tax=Zea mays TaxID=4577 RepID=A0A3L6E522_MAIZE|nr:Signal recognition particle protein [Zea mays]